MKLRWPLRVGRCVGSRIWPNTLFGRLVMILAIGMFAGQSFDSRVS
jgi:hypothetical protein